MKLRNPLRSPIRHAPLSKRLVDRQPAHRSTPPKIGSSIPSEQIMSEI
jgi:hypothetical protein